ncbi:GGDEF domain-containing response regulator [Prosthecomicrobium sp. N25]|uniref:GGDEF domain-containing response regulator n=1 Tax=Prosthecomicrobium sp. N25 TaxID=3129254 RepID=UPI0030783FD7
MKVVVVDSSRVVLKIMRNLLATCGHDATGFTDGESALDWIVGHDDVDVLITSLELPRMSGFELCWNVRLVDRNSHPIHILAMSSHAGHERLAEALDSGADDFINKPPHAEELSARLRAAERIRNAQAELIRLANHDSLTDLLNRRAFLAAAGDALAGARGAPLGLLMIDIDFFKRVNDTYGHEAGDDVIRSVARDIAALKAVAGRLGGEEFAVVAPGRDADGLLALAEGLRTTIAGRPVSTRSGPIPVTVSIGIALCVGGMALSEGLREADEALYSAKAKGRNQVEAGDLLGLPSASGIGANEARERSVVLI